MRFSLFPHLVKCIFYIWVPNMASFPGPILYFHHSDVQGGCWRYFRELHILSSNSDSIYSLTVVSQKNNV
jgi:hypothetical protein